MPSRAITLGIIALWLGAIGWASYRAWGGGFEPPPLLDRTDEVGLQSYRWSVLVEGKVIGHVQASIGRPRTDPRFALHASFTFIDGFRFRRLEIKTLKSTYHATPRGQLRELHGEVALGEHTAQVWCKLDDGHFWATISRDVPMACAQVTAEGIAGALNLLHPLHRLPGLRAGRVWSVTAFDPLDLIHAEQVGGGFYTLDATTAADSLTWDNKEVPCWRVDFRDGDKVRARVWARRENGLVLQQEAYSGDMRIIMERDPDHGPGRQVPGLKLPGLSP